MRQKIGYILLVIAFLILLIWGVNQFILPLLPPSVNSSLVLFFAVLLSVLGGVAKLKGAVESLEYIWEKLRPKSNVSQTDVLYLDSFRGLKEPLNNEQVKEFVTKWLSDDSDRFLAQVLPQDETKDGEGILSFLIRDPSTLESLLYVFQECPNSELPRNEGTLLDRVARIQWLRKDIKQVSGWVPFDQMQSAFSQLAFDMIQYKGRMNFDRKGIISTLAHARRSFKWTRLNKVLKLFAIIARILVFIVTLPLWLLYLVANLILPRRISYRLRNFLNKVNLVRIIDRKKSLSLLSVAEKAHLIKVNEKGIHFYSHYWQEYFAAVELKSLGLANALHPMKYDNSWKRLPSKWDPVIISMCGIVNDPNKVILELSSKDAYLAAKCVLNIEDVPLHVRQEVAKYLTINLLDEQNDRAGEQRSVDSAEALSLLGDPSVVPDILEAISIIHVSYYRDSLVSTIINFGANAVPALLSTLKDKNLIKMRYAVKALGKIGDSRAIKPLSELLDHPEHLVKMAAADALALLDHNLAKKQLVSIATDDSSDIADLMDAWYALASRGPSIVPDMIDMLRENIGLKLAFRKTIEYKIGESAVPFLIEELDDASNKPELKAALIETLGKLKSSKAVVLLISAMNEENRLVRINAIEALGEIADVRAVRSLIATLFDSDSFIRGQAAEALGNIKHPEAVRGLKKLLVDDQRKHEFGKQVSVLAAEALVQIRTPDALDAATKWYANRLSDQSKTISGIRVCDEAVTALTIIGTSEAYKALNEWQSEKSKGE